MLYDDERVLAVVRQTTDQSFGQVEMDKPVLQEDVVQSVLRLVARYRQDGFDAVAAMIESNVLADKREEVLEACFNVLQTLLGELYLELLANEGVDIEQDFAAEEGLFLDEVLAAIGSLGSCASPFYLQLTAFDFVQASGLQIARTPGKNVVYFGFALLIAGVFLMFYVPNRWLWCWIDQQEGTGRVLLAGTGNRHQGDFKEEFEHLCGQLDARWKTS